MNIEGLKNQMRKEIRETVAGLTPSYCSNADQAILDCLFQMPEYITAGTIFCYVGRKQEINTIPLIEDALIRGKRVGVPRCTAKGIMEVYQIGSLNQLVSGQYGIMEPGPDTNHLLPEELELAVVPCLSCSHDGKRLGYGGGYYDRYLEQSDAYQAVLCRERVVREDIPVENHDRIMDAVITELGIRRMEKYHAGQ